MDQKWQETVPTIATWIVCHQKESTHNLNLTIKKIVTLKATNFADIPHIPTEI